MLLALGACVSFLGFASVTILCGPRFLVALADDGMLPKAFGVHHPKFGTPVVAVVVTCASAAVGGLVAGAGGRAAEQFDRLTALSNVAVLVQYATTCLAVLLLPGGEVVSALRRRSRGGSPPITGLGVCLFLGYLIALEPNPWMQVAGFAGWTAAGVLLAGWTRRSRGTEASAEARRKLRRVGLLRRPVNGGAERRLSHFLFPAHPTHTDEVGFAG